NLNAPMQVWPRDFPCKQNLAGGLGAPVVAYRPGATYVLRLKEGGAVHGGGSCQVLVSGDVGRTWRVVKSIVGGCPDAGVGGGEIMFRVPEDVGEGSRLFAW